MPLVNGRFVADMKSPRTPDNEEPAAERACDFRPVDKGFTEEMALAEAERCLNCKKPFCVEGCPVNINIPRFIEQIRAKDFGGALDTIREDSMLPAICGRVCPQENQCEGKCIRGKKSEPVAIEGAIEEIPCDVAISAIGTNANPFAAKIGGKMELNKWGYIVADEETGQTTDPRIWAGGDIVTGAATVILAMGAGKKAAASITKSLLGE